MRISLLLQREPFVKILEQTLTKFLQSSLGRAHIVKWRHAPFFVSYNQHTQIWLCNPYLNAIFLPGVHKDALLPMIQEFSRSPIWWRRPFQKLYVALATSRMPRRWFANAALEITPPLAGAKHLVILGGNQHIRLLDYNEGVAFVIQKTGFDRALMGNDMRVRKENPYLPCPGIKRLAEDGSWYSEELILGTPVNRLRKVDQGKEVAKTAMIALFRLYEKTARKVRTDEYASGIINRIEGRIRQCPHLNQKTRDNLLKDLRALREILNSCQHKKIIIAQTHGDFQPANILLGEVRTWLIDWEYTAERQIAYDGLVFALKARFPLGLEHRVLLAMNGDLPGCEDLLASIPYVQWQSKEERRNILTLFLLEELDLKVMEINNPLFFTLDQGFRTFWAETKRAIQGIKSVC